MSITIHKILHFIKKLRDIKKIFEKVTHFTPLHPMQSLNGGNHHVYVIYNDFSMLNGKTSLPPNWPTGLKVNKAKRCPTDASSLDVRYYTNY